MARFWQRPDVPRGRGGVVCAGYRMQTVVPGRPQTGFTAWNLMLNIEPGFGTLTFSQSQLDVGAYRVVVRGHEVPSRPAGP